MSVGPLEQQSCLVLETSGGSGRTNPIVLAREEMMRRHPELGSQEGVVGACGTNPRFYKEFCRIRKRFERR